jgi:hypothetical protein
MSTTIDPAKYEGVAKAFAEVALERWPEFLQFAMDEDGSLRFDIPAPSGATDLMIIADIDCDEIIIGIGGGHSHGGPWQQPGDPDYQMQASIRFIGEILRDEVVGCSHKGGGGSIGEIEYLRSSSWWPTVVEVRSWSGARDEDRQAQQAGAQNP